MPAPDLFPLESTAMTGSPYVHLQQVRWLKRYSIVSTGQTLDVESINVIAKDGRHALCCGQSRSRSSTCRALHFRAILEKHYGRLSALRFPEK